MLMISVYLLLQKINLGPSLAAIGFESVHS
jgi:hypothetical protein